MPTINLKKHFFLVYIYIYLHTLSLTQSCLLPLPPQTLHKATEIKSWGRNRAKTLAATVTSR